MPGKGLKPQVSEYKSNKNASLLMGKNKNEWKSKGRNIACGTKENQKQICLVNFARYPSVMFWGEKEGKTKKKTQAHTKTCQPHHFMCKL